jgi:hypothetical protein
MPGIRRQWTSRLSRIEYLGSIVMFEEFDGSPVAESPYIDLGRLEGLASFFIGPLCRLDHDDAVALCDKIMDLVVKPCSTPPEAPSR